MNWHSDEACETTRTTLSELVRDPLIGLMMKSDGVDRRSIELLFERLANQRRRLSTSLADGACARSAC